MIKRVWLLVILLFITVVIAGCATTKVTSFKDPVYGDVAFSRLIVAVQVDGNYELKKMMEDKMVERFAKNKIFAVQSYKLFPPTRVYKDSELNAIVVKNNFDGMLTIQLAESPISIGYVPPVTYVNPSGVSSTTSGHDTYSKSSYLLSRLIDFSNGQGVWLAESKVELGGYIFTNSPTMISEASGTLLDRLVQDGMIKGLRWNVYIYGNLQNIADEQASN